MYSTAQAIKPVPFLNAENLPVISANPLDLPAAIFKRADRRRSNRAALMAWCA